MLFVILFVVDLLVTLSLIPLVVWVGRRTRTPAWLSYALCATLYFGYAWLFTEFIGYSVSIYALFAGDYVGGSLHQQRAPSKD